jgi:hypothetical protein
MKIFLIKTLLLFPFSVLTFCFVSFSVFAQNESESPIHELPRADQCDVITISIREVAFSRKQVLKELFSLEESAGLASKNGAYNEQQINEYHERVKLLQERVSSFQKQIDTKEQQLENCLQHSTISSRARK